MKERNNGQSAPDKEIPPRDKKERGPGGAGFTASLKICMQYFVLCFVMGAVCFGGGYGMIPIMEREFVQKRNYITKEEMVDILAIAQSVPGLISVNTIIMIGYRRKGFFCALAGTIGMALPSLVTICLVALAYAQIITNKYVQAVFTGVRAGVIALLVNAIIKLIKSSVIDIVTLILLLISTALIILNQINVLPWLNPIYIILAGAVTGIITKSVPGIRKKTEIRRGK